VIERGARGPGRRAADTGKDVGNDDSRSDSRRPVRTQASRIRRALFALVAGVLLAPQPASAEVQIRTIDIGGALRSYMLFLPDTTTVVDRGTPLLVALHGGGTPAELMRLYSRFDDIAAREQFAVAYPYGVGRWWNDGRLAEGLRESDADDVAFVRALIADIDARIKIDHRRIFATGISNGGFMSMRLACEASNVFAAIAIVAATMPEDLGARCRPSKPVSVLVINGTADALVPYVGGFARTANTLRGAIWSTDRTVAFWANHNRCAERPALSVLPDIDPTDGSRVIEAEFRQCAGAPVRLLRVEGGGHTWPGGLQLLPTVMLGNTNRDLDASEAIWSFFKAAPAR
jgi:polyhydroxybutyrate depolymerase